MHPSPRKDHLCEFYTYRIYDLSCCISDATQDDFYYYSSIAVHTCRRQNSTVFLVGVSDAQVLRVPSAIFNPQHMRFQYSRRQPSAPFTHWQKGFDNCCKWFSTRKGSSALVGSPLNLDDATAMVLKAMQEEACVVWVVATRTSGVNEETGMLQG